MAVGLSSSDESFLSGVAGGQAVLHQVGAFSNFVPGGELPDKSPSRHQLFCTPCSARNHAPQLPRPRKKSIFLPEKRELLSSWSDEAMVVDGAVVLPSVDVSRLQAALASSGGGGEGFEMAAASARLCKSLQAIRSNNGGTAPLVGYSEEHVAYGPPPVHHRLQGPSSILHTYKMGVPAALVSGNGNAVLQAGRPGGRGHGHDDEQQLQVVVSSKKKPRLLQSRPAANNILPSFKVRKEKLGDRIAALQQLVSPFGKTDTASVLMEAIGYIKFLQDQVETLSGPYMRSSKHKKARTTLQRGPSNAGDQKEEAKVDLRSRGLCLVPLSCTSYVTNENGIWAPPEH